MEHKSVLSGTAIVVLDRGFVYVGQVTIDGDWCVITDAQNVRRWGTTRGPRPSATARTRTLRAIGGCVMETGRSRHVGHVGASSIGRRRGRHGPTFAALTLTPPSTPT